jgi:hypothetical protein
MDILERQLGYFIKYIDEANEMTTRESWFYTRTDHEERPKVFS